MLRRPGGQSPARFRAVTRAWKARSSTVVQAGATVRGRGRPRHTRATAFDSALLGSQGQADKRVRPTRATADSLRRCSGQALGTEVPRNDNLKAAYSAAGSRVITARALCQLRWSLGVCVVYAWWVMARSAEILRLSIVPLRGTMDALRMTVGRVARAKRRDAGAIEIESQTIPAQAKLERGTLESSGALKRQGSS